MNIAVIGVGYVGLVSGACFAKIGHNVICVDNDKSKISKLSQGIIPIFEPGLSEIVSDAIEEKKISFTDNLKSALDICDVVFIAVGTPQDEDGSADLSFVLQVAKSIAENSASPKLIITKSTVPAGTGKMISDLVLRTNPKIKFSIASNPEFLREGCAIDDFMNPDRIVAGISDEKSKEIFEEIYKKFPAEKLIFTDVITAELIKYASNSFLATKISFINEMADLCETVGGNIKDLSKSMGLDSRIGNKFLNPGPGFGGSCFPKDIMAIINVAKKNNVNLSLISSVIDSNKNRKIKMVQKISDILGGKIEGKKIALLGLAFKANTDDIRYSPAISIAQTLLEKGAVIFATDEEAIENAKLELKAFDNISFFTDFYEATKDADLILIVTEWGAYSQMDLDKVKKVTNCRKILDLRNILDAKKVVNNGFEYHFIGGKTGSN